MWNRAIAPALAFGGLLLAGSAGAQDSERYRLEKTPEGYVRMDTRTGELWMCRERRDELVCRRAADALEEDGPAATDALRARITALEARVETLERALGEERSSGLPSEEEFEQTMGLMERFFRRFMDIVEGLEKDEPQPQDSAPVDPNRT